MISVITPTCDRPQAFALAERWMSRQTRQPDEWIVVDGGEQPVTCTHGQRHIHQPGGVGYENFLANLATGIDAAAGDSIIFWEDDDYYAPTHLAATASLLATPGVQLAGDPSQRYYNVNHRRWHLFHNRGASLCQTGMARSALPWFRDVLDACRATKSYGVDGRLWVPALCGTMQGVLQPLHTVVGIKGIPGRTGLGVGHRPAIVAKWTPDPSLSTLRTWIGADADVYARYRQPQTPQTREARHGAR